MSILIGQAHVMLQYLEHSHQVPRFFNKTNSKISTIFSNLAIYFFFIYIHQPQYFINIGIKYYFFPLTFLIPDFITTEHSHNLAGPAQPQLVNVKIHSTSTKNPNHTTTKIKIKLPKLDLTTIRTIISHL